MTAALGLAVMSCQTSESDVDDGSFEKADAPVKAFKEDSNKVYQAG